MQRRDMDTVEQERRHNKLVDMGLEPVHKEKFKVPASFFYTVDDLFEVPEIVIDFSAIAEDFFIAYLSNKIYQKGLRAGKRSLAKTIIEYGMEDE